MGPQPGLWRKLGQSFYERPAEELARDLIGKIIVHRLVTEELRARIVETEAYVGEHDLASHASKGRTARTEVMFGPPGIAYVYLCYGIHDMFNIVAARRDDAQAVLIRAAAPLDGRSDDLSGPGRLTRVLRITRQENGLDLTGDRLFLVDDNTPQPRIVRTPRIGVDYAEVWKDAPLRFLDADSPSVSGKRRESVPEIPPGAAQTSRRQ